MTPRQAVYLVGGKGTRLGALTKETPKPLLEIAPGVRFLDVVLEEAARHGFTDILLLAGYLGDQVAAAYHGKNVREAKVSVLREPAPQGTGGALKFAEAILAPTFLMGNGDSLFDINLSALGAPLSPGAVGRLALREVPDPARYGAVETAEGRVSRFLEKNSDLKGPALINGGLYYFDRSIVSRIDGPCSIESDIFPLLADERALEATRFDGYFIDMGLPDTYAIAQKEIPSRRRACAFLDRDGVLNVDKGYTHKPEDLVWIDGAQDMIRTFNDHGLFVIVVTNQAGVARGFYDEAAVSYFHQEMQNDLRKMGAHIDAFYMCPYHEDGVVTEYAIADHPDRKPNPGMLKKAMAQWPIDTARSFMIGDKQSDMAAAKAINIPGFLFDGTGLPDLARDALRCYLTSADAPR